MQMRTTRPLAALGIIIAVGAFTYTRFQMEDTPVAEIPDVAFVAAASRGAGTLPNGEYTTRGSYAPHGVTTEIDVTVTLEDDRITESNVVLLTEDRISVLVTERFQGGYKTEVIGKPIQDVALGVISGSSLTPMGYNEALRKIETYAAAL